jgi:hypothetical protein
MRVLCSVDNVEFNVSDHALLRSLLLAEIHSLDPEGFIRLPCDSRTWEAWHLGDTATMHEVTMMLAVLEVRCWAVSFITSRAEFSLQCFID